MFDHPAYMREWRKTHPLKGDARLRASARSYANVYKRRGLLKPRPCEKCGDPAQMHHRDYSKPLVVDWLCRRCHLDWHQFCFYESDEEWAKWLASGNVTRVTPVFCGGEHETHNRLHT